MSWTQPSSLSSLSSSSSSFLALFLLGEGRDLKIVYVRYEIIIGYVMKKQICIGNTDLLLVIVFSILVAEFAAPSLDYFGLAVDYMIELEDEAKYHIDGIWMDMAKLL